jgi:hypothetical protein
MGSGGTDAAVSLDGSDGRHPKRPPTPLCRDRSSTLCRDDNTTVGLIAVINRTNKIGLWRWIQLQMAANQAGGIPTSRLNPIQLERAMPPFDPTHCTH